MGGVNLPITSPLWIAQRIAEGLDLPSEKYPKEEVDHIEKDKVNCVKPKTEKAAEKDLEGMSQMHKLHSQLSKNIRSGAIEISMTDTGFQQGVMAHSTKEIPEPKKNEYKIAVED
jgi:hypothetical protein